MGGNSKGTFKSFCSEVVQTPAAKPGVDCVQRLGAGPPRIVRVHHRHFVHLDPAAAVGVFEYSLSVAPSPLADDVVLVAGGDFAGVAMPNPFQVRLPSRAEFESCLEAARSWGDAFAEIAKAKIPVPALFGLDVYACSSRTEYRAVAQLVVRWDPSVGVVETMGSKRLPAGLEPAYVYLMAEDHGLPRIRQVGNLGATLALSCHDTTAWHPRAIANTTELWRRKRRQAVQNDILRDDVETVFNAIHSLPSVRTFAVSYGKIREKRPALRLIPAFGCKYGVNRAEAISFVTSLQDGRESSIEIFPPTWW